MSNAKNNDASQGMDFLQSMPRRWVTIYIPIVLFVIVLLFPFYWMAITSFKPDNELLSRTGNPFWIVGPRSRISRSCCSRPNTLRGSGTR